MAKATDNVATKAALLGAIQMPTKVLDLPVTKVRVKIQALDAEKQARWEHAVMDVSVDKATGKVTTAPRLEGHEIKMAALGMIDPKLTEREVGMLPPADVRHIAAEIQSLSGTDVTLEEAEGN